MRGCPGCHSFLTDDGRWLPVGDHLDDCLAPDRAALEADRARALLREEAGAHRHAIATGCQDCAGHGRDGSWEPYHRAQLADCERLLVG